MKCLRVLCVVQTWPYHFYPLLKQKKTGVKPYAPSLFFTIGTLLRCSSSKSFPPPLSFSTGDLCVVVYCDRRSICDITCTASSFKLHLRPPISHSFKLRFRLHITSNLRFCLFSTS